MGFDALVRQFEALFPACDPPRLCRAPGRVNLIGEHLDYNGLPVLPVAMGEEVRVAFAPADDGRIELRNMNPAYATAVFANTAEIPPSDGGAWENYVKAAVQGINRALDAKAFPGMKLLVDSNLPAHAGLSSSSALVVASAMAYLGVFEAAHAISLDRIALAECLARAEHYVGTQGGGMDQAAILCGKRGHAVKVDFFPLRIERVPMINDVAVVVCDSLVSANKTGDALLKYNAGPASCRLATALVEHQLREDFGGDIQLKRLGDLWYGHLCLTHQEAHDLCMSAIPDARTTVADVGRRLGLTAETVRETWLGAVPEPQGGFRLRARLRHIISEFRRVETARDALLAGEAEMLGELFNASHISCAEDYEISCPALDALAAACRDAGALGARLTGAGFGGAVVSLVPCDRTESFLKALAGSFYRRIPFLAERPPWSVVRVSNGASYV